jgi:peptidoglycan/LPS O-acetylase OafA/YrhL
LKRIPSLDGLRAISICLVIAGHWTNTHYGVDSASAYANLGVRIFFVISGFLITTLLLKEEEKTGTINLRNFYVRRAYRILPAAFAFMLPMFVIYWHELRWQEMAAAVFFVMNFDFHKPWSIGHLWSLGVEEQFYFLWPGIFKSIRRHRVGVLLGVIVGAPFVSEFCFWLRLPGGDYGIFPTVADNLAIGCLLAVVIQRIPAIRPWLAACMLLVIAAVPAFPATSAIQTTVKVFVLWPLMQVCIAGVLLHVVRHPYRILNLAPVAWLGRISYSLYLWQQCFTFTHNPKPWYFIFVVLGLACASYYLVEQPMLRVRNSRKPALPPSRQTPSLCAVPAGD